MAERTCVSCRLKRPASELQRLVLQSDVVVLARPGAPGRGAWVCRQKSCVLGLTAPLLGRSLRVKPSDDALSDTSLNGVRDAVLWALEVGE